MGLFPSGTKSLTGTFPSIETGSYSRYNLLCFVEVQRQAEFYDNRIVWSAQWSNDLMMISTSFFFG